VAVLREPEAKDFQIRDQDIEWTAIRGSGPGGQNRNKVASCVQMRHKPSGLMVRCETERSQNQNYNSALSLLRARLLEQQVSSANNAENQARRDQVGCGARGDKTWTIRTQDGIVTDHKTGRKIQLREYLKGNF
jgi:peptide chain release factor 1